jgi:hypothetical protein
MTCGSNATLYGAYDGNQPKTPKITRTPNEQTRELNE